MPAPGKWRSYEKFPVRVPPIGIIQSSWMIIIETYGDDWGSPWIPHYPHRKPPIRIGRLGFSVLPKYTVEIWQAKKKRWFPRKIPRNRRNWDLPGWIVESPSGQSCMDVHLGRPPSPSREWFQKRIRGHPLRSTSIYQEMFIHQSQTSRFLMLVTMKNGSPIINGLWESPFFLSSMVPTYNNHFSHFSMCPSASAMRKRQGLMPGFPCL